MNLCLKSRVMTRVPGKNTSNRHTKRSAFISLFEFGRVQCIKKAFFRITRRNENKKITKIMRFRRAIFLFSHTQIRDGWPAVFLFSILKKHIKKAFFYFFFFAALSPAFALASFRSRFPTSSAAFKSSNCATIFLLASFLCCARLFKLLS